VTRSAWVGEERWACGWLPQLRAHTPPPVTPAGPSLLRRPLAWQVTLYFGLQALSFYAVLGWLPTIYQDHGYRPAAAGLLLSVSGLVQIPVGLTLPALAARVRDQRVLIGAASGLIAAGLAGVLVAPTMAPYLWAVLIGVGQGACFALALSLFVLRTRQPTETARLSAMAQSIGYLVSAVGPLLVGVLYAATSSWVAPLWLLLLLLVPQVWCGVLAGRARWVDQAELRHDQQVS
jgi:MFS transporter, CP family, cyanate transporter